MATNPPIKSIPVEISLKKMLVFYANMTLDLPMKAYEKMLNMTEKLSTRRSMRTGPAAAIALPISIILRFAAKGGKLAMMKGGLDWLCVMGGIGTVGAGWWLAGKAAFAALSATSAMAGMPALVTGAAAAIAVVPALLPLMAVGMIATSMAAATIGAHVAILPAGANIITGISRSRDYFRGYKNQNYGEVFSDDIPAAPIAPLLDIEEEYSLKPKKPAAPVFNSEAAIQLGNDITYKKIKLRVKTPVA